MRRSPLKISMRVGIVCSLFLSFCLFALHVHTAYAYSSTTVSVFVSQSRATTPLPAPTLSPSPAPTQSSQSASQGNFQDYFLLLISGLVGAITGVLGTLYATRSQISAIYAHEKENREYAARTQKETMRNSFAMEIQENLNLGLDVWAGEL